MRGFAIISIMLLFMSSLWISACSTSPADRVAERVIQAEPAQIVEALGHGLQADGMRLISRSDQGDFYETRLSADQLRGHAMLSEIAQNGEMTLRARVSRTQIEFTSNFPDSDTEVGFLINLSPAADGAGTIARLEPLVRGSAAEADPERVEALRRGFASRGERLLEGIAASVEG